MCASPWHPSASPSTRDLRADRAACQSLNRALRRCRQPRSLPDAQEDMGRLLCGFVQGRADAASLWLAGMPSRALALEPLTTACSRPPSLRCACGRQLGSPACRNTPPL